MKNIVSVAAMSFFLAGCASGVERIANVDPQSPGVSVVDGKHIVVDQEPLYFSRGMKDVMITWRLPAGSAYRFPRDGITIRDAGGEFTNCHPEHNGLRFSCLNVHAMPGTYKYTIKVVGTPAVPELDPTIVNY